MKTTIYSWKNFCALNKLRQLAKCWEACVYTCACVCVYTAIKTNWKLQLSLQNLTLIKLSNIVIINCLAKYTWRKYQAYVNQIKYKHWTRSPDLKLSKRCVLWEP